MKRKEIARIKENFVFFFLTFQILRLKILPKLMFFSLDLQIMKWKKMIKIFKQCLKNQSIRFDSSKRIQESLKNLSRSILIHENDKIG